MCQGWEEYIGMCVYAKFCLRMKISLKFYKEHSHL